jgi:hypothetical protein
MSDTIKNWKARLYSVDERRKKPRRYAKKFHRFAVPGKCIDVQKLGGRGTALFGNQFTG